MHPPARAAELVDLVPDLTDDLLNTVDQPLQLAKDAKGNAYLLCDYNRDGDSYRRVHAAMGARPSSSHPPRAEQRSSLAYAAGSPPPLHLHPPLTLSPGCAAALLSPPRATHSQQVSVDQRVRPAAGGRRAALAEAAHDGEPRQRHF